jgi:HSP20 family protein
MSVRETHRTDPMEGSTMKSISIYDPRYRSDTQYLSDTLLRVDPFDLLDRLFEENGLGIAAARSPLADVREDEKGYQIEVELPGLSEKDLSLELKEGLLTLSTKADEEKKEVDKAGKWLRRERKSLSFKRSFELPEDADGEKIEARFKDGLLVIGLPRKPETAPRIVPVKAA